MKSRNQMFDQMGVYQHHDAVTGTSKQFVANDYANTLFSAMDQSQSLFNKLVGEQAKRFANVESTEWLQCFRTNSTYLDCPIA